MKENTITKQPKYSIVVPAFREELFIGSTLDSLYRYLRTTKSLDKTEVVVVVAESTDKTAAIVKSKRILFPLFNIIEPGKREGKGRDVRAGVLAAQGQYILFTDADLATPLRHINEALALLEKGYDVVIGERKLKEVHKKFHSRFGEFVSIAGNWLSRFLIAPDTKDTQCGFKGFDKKAAQTIFSRLTIMGWVFDMEVIAIARQKHLKIASVDIYDWRENKPYKLQLAGQNRLSVAAKSFLDLIRIKRNLITGKYKKPFSDEAE